MHERPCSEDCMSYSGESLLGGKLPIANPVKFGNHNSIPCDKDGPTSVGPSYVASGKGSMVYIGMADTAVDKMSH